MILHEINHKMPIYKDCTLGEMMCIGAFVLIAELLILPLLTRLLFGYAAIGIAITLMSFFHLSKFMLGKLQRIKYGKPHGYYQQLIIKHLVDKGVIKSPYLCRCGKWSVRRMGS